MPVFVTTTDSCTLRLAPDGNVAFFLAMSKWMGLNKGFPFVENT